jgi:hypothetical protein
MKNAIFKTIIIVKLLISFLPNAISQNLPDYLPTDGLVGWWNLNNQANDESANNINCTIVGASPTEDRFGNLASAYYFDGNSYIYSNEVSALPLGDEPRTFSLWLKPTDFSTPLNKDILNWGNATPSQRFGFTLYNGIPYFVGQNNDFFGNSNLNENNWYFVLLTYDGSIVKLYVDGVLDSYGYKNLNTTGSNLIFGRSPLVHPSPTFFIGCIDDIGIWNRVLEASEIQSLYEANNCELNTTISPENAYVTHGEAIIFSANSANANTSFIWQSDLGQGFQTLNDYGQYSGVNSAALSIANVQLSEHLQQVRAISTSGNCVDTSNVAVIQLLDTCLVTTYDTLFTTVTDTLVINTSLVGIDPPANQNTIQVFPNPANTHITIDYGNYNAMNGYALQITNSLGALVFNASINQQTSYIDLATWTGNGLYFVHIIDPQGNTIDIRKIVLE